MSPPIGGATTEMVGSQGKASDESLLSLEHLFYPLPVEGSPRRDGGTLIRERDPLRTFLESLTTECSLARNRTEDLSGILISPTEEPTTRLSIIPVEEIKAVEKLINFPFCPIFSNLKLS